MKTTSTQSTPAAEQALAAGRYAAIKLAPYFRPVLARMRFIPADDLPTAGTTAKGICYYNPSFIASLNAKECAFVLLHEASHLWLRHHARTQHYKADHGQANCAQDRAINPALLAMGLPAPKLDGKPCCLLPKDINAADNLSWEEYYALQQEQEKKSGQSGQGKPQPGQGKPNGVANGQCGSCSTGKDDPTHGDPSDAPSDGEMERAAKAVSQAMVDAEKSKRGSVPGGFLRSAELSLTPPQIKWNTKLRSAVQATLRAVATGGVVSSYRGISRRQWGVGYKPGSPILPVYKAPKPRVCVVLDTSGSMGRKDTQKALSEIAGIVKLTDVSFVACDAAVYQSAPKQVASMKDLLPLIKGGGGSSFIPAFDMLAKDPPDIVVFLTDGDIGVPAENPLPKSTKVFWAVINQGYRNTAPTEAYGVALKID